MAISKETTLEELAVIVSTQLESAGISAVLSGGAAVSIYSHNAYQSADLDFVTSEGKKMLEMVVQDLGFKQSGSSRMFEHSESQWYIEFPPGPLGFGDTYVDFEDIPLLTTSFGQLRVITPTQSVMDRLAAFWYHFDRQCWDQAIEVCKRQQVNWKEIRKWAKREKQDLKTVDKLKEESESSN